ncbi:hypothetical protein FDP41_000182 [Naegleria fowleri]|uniref:Fungal lipase-type domain-containing protein n=1 Tax=Naegleria fowleri TaxID=5763 RepID=A0A6A5C407_NAEFO|nr:uncharacterized protein FDP41_000182 [Naegleria fowleri]KAF0985143.1 hypothetical protein FDP41_000182 [Naegleria fowleri]CAG4715177.1 unnamed protein product [Naegleria fowleri]
MPINKSTDTLEVPYKDEHSVLYEHHQKLNNNQSPKTPALTVSPLEEGDQLAVQTIVEEEKKLEESDFSKSGFQKTKSLFKIATDMMKHSEWEWSDSIGLGYYLNFRKEKIERDFSHVIDEAFKYNSDKRCFVKNDTEISIDTIELWKEYITCIRLLFKEYDNLILKTTFDYADILEYEPKGNAQRSAYAICRDTNRKSLLLLIEGTKSFHDLLTDLNAEAFAFKCDAFSSSENHFVHSGMLERAYWFYYQIIPKIEKYLKKDFPDYSFTIVGHSLGAGTAAILTLLLVTKMPNIRCLAFACPKIFSHELARSDLVKRYITTFINQDDFVPLFSVESFREFKIKRMTNWKSEVMNETQLGKFLKSTDTLLDQSGVYNAFSSLKNGIMSGYNYIVNGSEKNSQQKSPTTSTPPSIKKKSLPPLPKSLTKKRLIKVQEFKDQQVDEEDDLFFSNLVKQYEESISQQDSVVDETTKESCSQNQFTNSTDGIVTCGEATDLRQENVVDASTTIISSSDETVVEEELESHSQTTFEISSQNASDGDSVQKSESTISVSSVSTTSNVQTSMRELPKLPQSFTTGVHLYSPETLFLLRTIDSKVYLKQCKPSEFEHLDFVGSYVADHFSKSYIASLEGLLQSTNRKLPPLPSSLLAKKMIADLHQDETPQQQSPMGADSTQM